MVVPAVPDIQTPSRRPPIPAKSCDVGVDAFSAARRKKNHALDSLFTAQSPPRASCRQVTSDLPVLL
jgi:hypothetical protein